MAKASKITVTDMQMRVLNSFDRDLRQSKQHTSGLLRNAPVDKWKSAPGLKAEKPMSTLDKKIAALKAEIARFEAKGL